MIEGIKEFLHRAYQGACAVLAQQTRETIYHKSANDVLTQADVALNEYLTRLVQESFPYARIIAEESENNDLTDDLTFVIDPLDGTCNFARGIPLHGIQIAVLQKKECVASIIGMPKLGKVYYAEKGKGAFCNGEKLTLDSDASTSEGVLALSDFYQQERDIAFEKQFALVASLQGDFLKTRLFGAACFDFAAIAESYAQCYICYYRHIWDIAPGLLLAHEAGALHCRLNGAPYSYGDQALLVANNKDTLEFVLAKAKPFLN